MADILKRGAASFIAKFEYKFHILAIEGVAGLLFFFFVVSEERQNFTGIVSAIIIALIVGFFSREWIFSRLLLKKCSDEQLRALWLKYGGFRRIMEADAQQGATPDGDSATSHRRR